MQQAMTDIGDPLLASTRAERDSIFADRRSRAPVAPVENGALFISTFEGVKRGLTSVDHFVGSFGNVGDLPEEETVLPGVPEPRHGKIRKIINTVLAYHHASQLEDFVREQAGAMIDGMVIAAKGGRSVDLCQHLARPLPSTVIAEVLSVPGKDVPRFAEWSDEILQRITESGPSTPLGDLHPEFAAYVDTQINERLKQIDDGGNAATTKRPEDFVSRMLTTDVDGEHLTPRAVRTQIVNLIIAGNETTRNLIGNLFHRLAQEPELWTQLREDRSLCAAAIEESLRMDSPVQFLARTCTQSIEIEGYAIKPGDRVLMGVASANFDEAVFEEPKRFRLDRVRPREHAGFGFGPHLCPGAFLARMETAAALDLVLDRVESIRLTDSYVFDTNPVPFTYGPDSLAVEIVASQS